MQFLSKPHKHRHLCTKESKNIKRTHLTKGKDSTYLFSQSLIIKMKIFIEEKDYKSTQRKIKDLFSLLLFLFSVQRTHVISIFVVTKKVWQPRSEIRAKTVKTRLTGSSLSSSRPNAAILVPERSYPSRSIFQIFVHMLIFFTV